MNLTLLRYCIDSYCTMGILTIEGIEDPIYHTIEKPWLGNAKNISSIPPGVYTVKPFKSTKFIHYPDVWEICNVPDRTSVLLHVANRADQLEGCIAAGLSAGYMQDKSGVLKKAVLNSQNALSDLKKIIGYPTEFQLTILG